MKTTEMDMLIESIGAVKAIGETNIDLKRLSNLETMCELVDRLVFEIYMASKDKDRIEESMMIIGKKADTFFE